MNIKRLKHLVALADERNFGRAAEQVHLSQPAFSRCLDRGASLAAYVFRHGVLSLQGRSFPSTATFAIDFLREFSASMVAS